MRAKELKGFRRAAQRVATETETIAIVPKGCDRYRLKPVRGCASDLQSLLVVEQRECKQSAPDATGGLARGLSETQKCVANFLSTVNT